MDNYRETPFIWEEQYKLLIKVLTAEFLSINQIDLVCADNNCIFFSFIILDVAMSITNL